ncbi:hypothetical protein GEMRC1_008915 [Eukaryota sp. GEM-RC1]
MDSASLLKHDTEPVAPVFDYEMWANESKGKSNLCCYVSLVLIVVAALVTGVILLFFGGLHQPSQLDLASDAVKLLEGSSFRVYPFTTRIMENKLCDVVVSTLRRQSLFHSPGGKDMDVRVRHVDNYNVFDVTLYLSQQSSTIMLSCEFDYDDEGAIEAAFQILAEAFAESISLVVPSDTVANRESAISDYCRDLLQDFLSIIEGFNIHTELNTDNYYTIRLISGLLTDSRRFHLKYQVIDRKVIEDQFDGYMEQILRYPSESGKGTMCIDGPDVYQSSANRQQTLINFIQQYIDDDGVEISLTQDLSKDWHMTMMKDGVDKNFVLDGITFREQSLNDLSGAGIKKLELGYGTVAILFERKLYVFNNNEWITMRDVTNHLYHKDVTDVALGDFHIVVLTSEKEVYCYGNNQYGQLGVEERAARHSKPWFYDDEIVSVYAGRYTSGAISLRQSHYLWGHNTNRKLYDDDVEVYDYPHGFSFPSHNSFKNIIWYISHSDPN